MGDPNLVTTYTFHGQEYLFKMNVLHGNLEILVTDKNSGEEWQCSFDATYIENLTQKTGNFKQFDIFVAMIKSGVLRTSESVTLDLLTYEDLELLRSRKVTKSMGHGSNNRRYLILTYQVEFDKIRYPLPLEYCGPPDPFILQTTIRRLELELAKTKEELAVKNSNAENRKVFILQKKVDELTQENAQLQEEIRLLNNQLHKKKPKSPVAHLQQAVSNLERCVVMERNSHHELVQKLRQDKTNLAKELEKVKCSERSLKSQLNRISRSAIGDHCDRRQSAHSLRTMYQRASSPVPMPEVRPVSRQESRRPRSRDKVYWKSMIRKSVSASRRAPSRTSSTSSANKFPDLESDLVSTSRQESPVNTRLSRLNTLPKVQSRGSSGNSSRGSSRASPRKSRSNRQRLDYKKLEQKIQHLQCMLRSNAKEHT